MTPLLHNCLSFLFLVYAFLTVQAKHVDPSYNEKCSLELQAILHKPKSCAFNYLQSLELRFREDGGRYLLFTAQADSFIYTFENTYNIFIKTADAFGQSTKYYPDGTKSLGSLGFYTDTAQSYMKFPGFVRQVSNQKFYYTFSIFSEDAQYKAVTFEMYTVDDPIFC